MGLKKPDDKGAKKTEGLGFLVRENATSSALASLAAGGALKGEELSKALHYILDLHDSARSQELTTPAGGVSFPSVAQALAARLGQFRSEDVPEASETPGRLGPKVMHVDRASMFGRLALSADGLKVESQGNFSSCRANACIYAGKWMYEATLGTSGIQQIGWATLACEFTNEEGVGDAADSYAFDGKRVKKWCVYPESYGQPWAPGDVIACCMDLDKGSLSFCRNGVSMGDAYPNVRILKPWLGYFPAISLSHGERCHLNFGSQPFRYPVEGYQPLQSQPSVDELAKIEYLWGCFSRLLEVTGPPQMDGRMSRSSPGSDVMLVPRSQMGVDDRVMLAAVIVGPLRSMLSCAYHIMESFIPFLRETAGRIDNMNTPNLHMALNLLEITLGKAEFQRIMVSVIETLSQLCGSSTFQPKELPDTASYPHLKLMNALLFIPTIRKLFFRLPNVNHLIEGFLTRKQPTPMDLKDLLPNVWYKGCKDDSASEERMNTVVKALSTALQKVEQSQFELMSVLFEEDRISGSKYVLDFFNHLLMTNQGANRNRQPPGLSDVSVLVSSFNLLLRLLRPSLMRQAHGHSCLEEFPARELFVDGTIFPEQYLHQDLPRLGGLLSYLQKEHPSALVASSPVHVPLDKEIGLAQGGPPLAEEHLVPHGMAGKLLHILVLLYRLGIEVAMKMTLHQFQTEVVQRAHLLRLETRLASQSNESLFKKRLEDVLMHREEVVKSVRHCTWYKVVLFMPWKQESMFLLTVYLSKMLSLLSTKYSDIFRYVPEAYVEALLDLFQAVAKIEPRFTDLENLESLGLQHVISFLVRHFNHPMVVNPQLCDIILQGMAVLFADKHFLRSCEKIQDAQETLVPDLLKTFDTRFWLSISNIILSVAKGTGFGQANGASNGGSRIFRQLLVITCREQPHLLDGFLNRLFNTLNWTVTELTVTFSEVDEQLERLAMAGANQGTTDIVRSYRKASVLFNLSINLLRLLELIAWLMPHVFLTGSGLNLSRVVEVIGFLLSHLTVGSDARVFNKVVDAPQSWPEWKSKVSRPFILAPIAGILSSLHKSSKVRGTGSCSSAHQIADGDASGARRGRNSGGVLWGSIGVVSGTVSGAVHHVQRALMRGWGGQRGGNQGDEGAQHTIAWALADSMSAPQECLEHLGKIQWKQCFPQASSSKLTAELQDVIWSYKMEVEHKEQVKENLGEKDSPPDDFLDPILMTLMEDPVILPDSRITVDRCTIERHLLTQQTDPFSRAELTIDMVIPNVELKQQIQEWQESN